ncbi:trypsin-like serine peptidase [Falsiroseomonas sp. HW251]|uniref:trypsin-like serine peptidase n=1 Tax=Falsiroseomonas sp. HW251 TaxID=3390998 RepID=UPI003D318D7F
MAIAARILLALLLIGAPAAAQQPRPHQAVPLPGIGSADPRQPASTRQAPWRSLGRVHTSFGGQCTGVVVGTSLVLTAAHCMVSPRTGQFVEPGSVHFLLGYERGSFNAVSRVGSYRVGQGFEPGRGPMGADWAVLQLLEPIGTPDIVLPLWREAPAPRTPVMLGGYQQDRPEVIMADTACRVLGLGREPSGSVVLVHDCAGTRGASGAPLLARSPDGTRWMVVGILSAVNREMALGNAVPAASIGGLY